MLGLFNYCRIEIAQRFDLLVTGRLYCDRNQPVVALSLAILSLFGLDHPD
jgi:hypothetical protein